jgi:hypothetical protein
LPDAQDQKFRSRTIPACNLRLLALSAPPATPRRFAGDTVYAALAQSVEHIIRNDGVLGSIPGSGTIRKI